MSRKKKRTDYQEKKSPAMVFAYYLTVLILVCLLGLMYLIWQNRNAKFLKQRDAAAVQETIRELAPKVDPAYIPESGAEVQEEAVS